uniref:Uncharacterized protein n=1 Tax=Rhipicephalus zambeziensis TaxID=60191 RepID=A0A224Z2D0_9ACAR
MEQAGRELMALQLATGKPVVQDSRRMSVISLAFTLKSVSHLAQAIFEADLAGIYSTAAVQFDCKLMRTQLARKSRSHPCRTFKTHVRTDRSIKAQRTQPV